MSRWARGLAIAGCCAYPLLNHAAVVLDDPRWAALGITLVVWVLASGWRRVLVAALLVVFTLALGLWVADHLPGLLLYVPPVAFNLAMCVLFALTLRRGHEPLLTRFARIGRSGQLAPDL